MPGSSLLSHGGDPTLPSALRRFTSEFGMGQVGPPRYRRQANSCCQNESFSPMLALAAFVKSVTYLSMILPLLHLPPCLSVKSFRSPKICNQC